jgi:hypothetical protein
MARASDDFYPKDSAAQTVHLVSCAYNTVMLGEIATTDWWVLGLELGVGAESAMFLGLVHPFAGMH